MNDNHFVSVIVATYQRDQTLKKALVSLAKQTYETIECIVVDDNADPIWNQKVESIVAAIEQQYGIHLIYIQNKNNLGSAEARNVGIHRAKGEYITFLDDDDLYLKNKIKHQLEHMVAHQADYSITDLLLYNESDKLIDRRIRNYIHRTDVTSLMQYHFMYHLTGTDAMMFKTSYLLQLGFFSPINIGDEFYLMEKAIKNNGVFCYFPHCDIKAYVHYETDGLSSGERKINGENSLYNYKKTLFQHLNKSTIRYIKMRHYAVLAFAEIRRNRYGAFLINGCKSFFHSPLRCLKMLIGSKR